MISRKRYEVKGTEFHVFYGGRFIEGTLKWVVSSKNMDALNAFEEEYDQLWLTKKEAIEAIHSHLQDTK